MENLDNNFFETQIFGDDEKSTGNNEGVVPQETIIKTDDIFDKNKELKITNTNIICDGNGFQDMLGDGKSDSAPDFTKYKFNNFRVSDNEYLIKLQDVGGTLIMFDDGELMLKSSSDTDLKKITEEKASRVVSQLIGEFVVIGRGTKDNPPDIKYSDLMLVSEVVFKPHIMAEFYEEGKTYKMNKFNPSEPLMLNKNTPYKKPVYTLHLIAHLVNYDPERFHYLINWLAFMFVYLNKSMVAIVLRGIQGSGKGLLFNKIITSLFGEVFVVTVGNKNLKSQFLAALFECRLFINLNEMSHDLKSNKELKNFIKELITELKLSAEKKYENLSKAIDLCAQILITSNEAYILEIEPEDRRFTVFSTAGNISHEECNFFGLGDFKVFKKQLELELSDFALYLKNYPIDTNLANTALNTPEKKALVKGTNDRFKLFINALLTQNIEYFEPLKVTDSIIYANIVTGFKKGRIYQRDILTAFIVVNPRDYQMSTQALLDKLEIYEPTKFSRELRRKSGDWYFNL
ncbi:primase-helicase family protein [Arcobacter peruensis]|uniref:primase-helicase family protein n=1 Tax=Arcobacter peruensis TaxID=2320140 RepID=UPI000F077252|nr:primase-helicase family protein [Arcobacter peruensis]